MEISRYCFPQKTGVCLAVDWKMDNLQFRIDTLPNDSSLSKGIRSDEPLVAQIVILRPQPI